MSDKPAKRSTRTNWRRVAETLRRHTPKKFYHADDRLDFELAIELCERQATKQQRKRASPSA